MQSTAAILFVLGLVLGLWRWGTLVQQQQHFGDDQEYLTMVSSFLRHGSPDFRPGDDQDALSVLPKRWVSSLHKKFFPNKPPAAYFESHDGKYYGWHFFTYSAAVVPMRAWLNGRGDAHRAHQYTNLVMLSLALLALLQLRSRPVLFWTLTPLAFVNPVLWFSPYAHTETFVFALGILALVAHLSGRPRLAMLCNSIAATQYQPLAPISVFLCVEWLYLHRKELRSRAFAPRVLAALACTAPILAPNVFYYLHFRAPNLIAREGMAKSNLLSFARFGGMFTDLDDGMFVWLPGLSLLLLLTAAWSLRRSLRERDVWTLGLLGCVLFGMFASTCQRNWNHPTFGVSRYVVYAVAPFLMYIGRELTQQRGAVRLPLCAAALALALQVALHSHSGWFSYRGHDSAHHGVVASYVLEHWPALYAAEPEHFCERTKQNRCQTEPEGHLLHSEYPIIWSDSQARARKILTRGCDPEPVLRARPWTSEEDAAIRKGLRGCHDGEPHYITL